VAARNDLKSQVSSLKSQTLKKVEKKSDLPWVMWCGTVTGTVNVLPSSVVYTITESPSHGGWELYFLATFESRQFMMWPDVWDTWNHKNTKDQF
jgi:hypothetical protein